MADHTSADPQSCFTWLHLSDLHLRENALAENAGVVAGIWAGLQELFQRTQPWHAVLFSGDMVNRGLPAEFSTLSQWVAELFERVQLPGDTTPPRFVTVPGNHDLIRPAVTEETTACLDRALHPEAWEAYFAEWRGDPVHPLRQIIAASFGNYEDWQATCITSVQCLPEGFTPGLFPGDGAGILTGSWLDVGLMCLNTATLQLSGGTLEGCLVWDPQQLSQACGSSIPSEWAASNQPCLLMTHHPPSWVRRPFVSEGGQPSFYPRNVSVHLCGHIHESRLVPEDATATFLWVAEPLSAWLDEKHRTCTRHGFSVGRIEKSEHGGVAEYRLRRWARTAVNHPVHGLSDFRPPPGFADLDSKSLLIGDIGVLGQLNLVEQGWDGWLAMAFQAQSCKGP